MERCDLDFDHLNCLITRELVAFPVVHQGTKGPPHVFEYAALWAQILANGDTCPICRSKIALDFKVDVELQADIDRVVGERLTGGAATDYEQLLDYTRRRAEPPPVAPEQVVLGVRLSMYTDFSAYMRRIQVHNALIVRSCRNTTTDRLEVLPSPLLIATAFMAKSLGSGAVRGLLATMAGIVTFVPELIETIKLERYLAKTEVIKRNLAHLHDVAPGDQPHLIREILKLSISELREFLTNRTKMDQMIGHFQATPA